jgi:replication-associated recombination protein RarA
LVAKARKLHNDPAVPLKILLYGPPGVGKTSIADMLSSHWPVYQATAMRIADDIGGWVRAALADLESWLDAMGV